MLLLFLFMVVVGVCGLVVGNALLIMLDPMRHFDRAGDRAIISTWIGLLTLANIFLVISLLGPLSPLVALTATLLLLLLSLSSAQNRMNLRALLYRPPTASLVGVTALSLGTAAYCTQVIVWYDSGLYHLQVIKWLSEFGLVPGLGLVHSRFGFISSWFALPAAFNHGVFEGRVAALPGALCLLLLLVHGLLAFHRIFGRRSRTQDLFMAAASMLVVPVILVWGMPNSPSPDFPVIVLIIVVAWTMSANSGSGKSHNDFRLWGTATLIPLVLAVGAVSIKLSALPLAMVAGCFHLFSDRFDFKKVLGAGCLVVLALAPVAAAGVVVSGCAFYPVAFLCADLPWTLGTTMAQADATIIRESARWGVAPTPAHATSLNWILPWFRNEKVCTALILFSLWATVSLLFRRESRTRQSKYVIFLGLAGILFMFYGAPTWRFGLGYLIVVPALAATSCTNLYNFLLEKIKGISVLNSFGFIGLISAAFIALHVHIIPRPSYTLLDEAVANNLVTSEEGPHFNLIFPPHIWNLSYDSDTMTGETIALENLIIEEQVGDIVYHRPAESDVCWDAPLPCSPSGLGEIELRLEDEGLRGGFEKITPQPGANRK